MKKRSSSRWVAYGYVIENIAFFVTLVVMMRIASPSEYGHYALGLVGQRLLYNLSEYGIKVSYIQARNGSKPNLYLLWLSSLIVSAMLYCLYLALLLGVISQFIEYNALAMAIVPLGAVFACLRNPTCWRLQANMVFKPMILTQLTGSVSKLILSISLGLAFGGLEGLVFGFVGGILIESVSTYIRIPFARISWRDWGSVKRSMRFSGWCTGSVVLRWVAKNLESVIVFAALGSDILGIYNRACSFGNLVERFSETFGVKVYFPLFTRVRNVRETFRKHVSSMIYLNVCVAVVPIAVLGFLGPEAVSRFFGDEWSGFGSLLLLFLFVGGMRAVVDSSYIALRNLGYSMNEMASYGIRILFIALLLNPLILRYDLLGVVILQYLNVVGVGLYLFYLCRRLVVPIWNSVASACGVIHLLVGLFYVANNQGVMQSGVFQSVIGSGLLIMAVTITFVLFRRSVIILPQ